MVQIPPFVQKKIFGGMADNQTGVFMNSLIKSHKELQFQLFAAVVQGLISADLVGRGFFISHGSDRDDFTIELWRSATKSEHGDGKLLHRYRVNRGAYEMNDVRLQATTSYIANECVKFVKEIAPVLAANRVDSVKSNEVNEDLNQEDNDLYDFANRALQNASAIASNKAGETINFGVTMADVKKWRDEFRPHYAPERKEGVK